MEEKIIKGLNQLYPVEIEEVVAVTEEMYRCTAKQGIYFARITNYKTHDEQLDEVKWTNYLHSEGFGAPQAIPSVKGRLIEEITLDDEKRTVLYKGSPGVHLPNHQWTPSVFKELGRQIGRLHRLSKKFERTEALPGIHDWHENEEYNFLHYIPKEQTRIREIAGEVLSAVKELPRNDDTYGLLHGDIWLENILVDRDSNIWMVDFQDCERHYYIFDLAVPIYSALEYTFEGSGNITEYGDRMTKAIIEGYQEEHALDPAMLAQLPLFLKLKELFEYSLMYMYWNTEKLNEEQLRIMNHFRVRIEQNHSILGIQQHT